MLEKHKLFIVSGHSGAGKTTIFRQIMNNEVVSFTTRQRREHEVDGIDYVYITKEKFDYMFENNGLVEWTQYPPEIGNFYGISKEELYGKLDKGNAFVIVDFHGALQLINEYDSSQIVTIFLYCPFEEAERRMRERGDSEEIINNRMATIQQECENSLYYDYVISNPEGKLQQTIEIVRKIVHVNSTSYNN